MANDGDGQRKHKKQGLCPSRYALAMIEFCEAATGQTAAGAAAGRRLLERVDRPETECFRLPFSLIRYARRLAELEDTANVEKPE